MKKAIVIGSGIAGLACSLRLQKQGYLVTVIEKNSYPGGKLHSINKKGYRFDMGPSLFTMPKLVTELFELFDENPDTYFKYKKKEVVCHYFWPDGSRFTSVANPKQWVSDASIFFNEKASKLERYLKKSALKYKVTAPLFIENSLHELKTYLSWKTAYALLKIPNLDIFKSLDHYNKSQFKSVKLQQFFNRFATYNGSSPYQASAVLSMIPSLEMLQGTYFPYEGMQAISQSLYHFAEEKGVQFLLEHKVTEIICKENKATGVQIQGLNGGESSVIHADIVVSNADVYHTYEHLLPHLKTPKKIKTQERSSSGLIFYWGIRKEFSELDLHNIFFSENYQKEFEDIFEHQRAPEDPTIYINISSKEKATDAPQGCENWFVMINVPANSGQDWALIREKAKEQIIKKLNKLLHIQLETLIETEEFLDPIKIEENTAAFGGALYGTSSNNTQAAFLRQSNRSKHIKNLFFCGGSAHPGGGIPLCLHSAKITANLIESQS